MVYMHAQSARGVLLLTLLLSPCVAWSTSTSVKDNNVAFDPYTFSPILVTTPQANGLEAVPATVDGGFDLAGLVDTQHPLLTSGTWHSSSTLNLIPNSSVNGDEDAIRPDPRPRMKKFMLIVLIVGGLVRYLTSPSYLKFVREVMDPWAS